MREDEVLAEIRDHLRAERANDAALEAVARGEAGTRAVAELEKRAAADPEIAAMVGASRPFGDDIVEKIAANVSKVEQTTMRPSEGGKVMAFARRALRYAGPVAVAAAVLLYLGLREPALTGALLPEYGVTATSEKDMRGVDEALPSLILPNAPGAEFEIVARPATAAAGNVVAYVFAIGEGEPNAVEAKIEIAAEGSVRIRGRGRALDGAREVRVVVGIASDSIKRYEDALSRARDGRSDAKIRVLVVPIIRQ